MDRVGLIWSLSAQDDKVYTYDGTKVTESTGTADDNVIDFRHTKLMPGMTIHYRISTINNAPTNQRKSRPSDSVIRHGPSRLPSRTLRADWWFRRTVKTPSFCAGTSSLPIRQRRIPTATA